jgi:sugar/nucleoside kinase (ribokinase family)
VEAHVLTGLAPREAALALAKKRAGALVRDGAKGAWIAADGLVTHIPAYPVTPVDTNGAGDAHTGAFIAALLRGEDARDATALANVAAALSTLYEGPATCPDLATTLAAMTAAGGPTPALAKPSFGGPR